MMRRRLEQLTPGMTLGAPVYNLKGVLLLREGEVLTSKYIQVFTSWGVEEVDVVNHANVADATSRTIPPRFRLLWTKK